MKEIISANVAGISFNFDFDAYEALESYFKALKLAYEGQHDGPEIVADITSRVAELILEEQSVEVIISKPLIDKIIAQTGLPDEAPVADNEKYEIPRRLYRNLEGSKIAGVCSGLGAYFNVDVALLRIIFLLAPILSIFSTGVFGYSHHLSGNWLAEGLWVLVLLYIVMWIVIPMARTPRQKLEMQGEKITAASIKRRFDYDYADSSPDSREVSSIFARFIGLIFQIAIVFMKIIAIIVGFVFAIVAVALIVAFFVILLDITGVISNNGWLPELVGISAQMYALLIIAVIMIPFIIIVSVLISMLFKARYSRTVATVFIGIWIIIALFAVIVTARNYHILRDNDNYKLRFEYGVKTQRNMISIERMKKDSEEVILYNDNDTTTVLIENIDQNGDN